MSEELKQIEAVLNEKVRPSLRAHGGELEIDHLADGVLYIKLLGQCAGCPSADLTNETLIEHELTAALPELVQKVVVVQTVSDELWEQAGGSEQLVNGRTAFDAMRRGDASAKAVVDGYVHYLCVGITSIVNIFQPEVLCVGGGISREGEAVMAPVRAYVGKYGYARGSAKQPRIVAASLAGDAGIIGAALLGTEKK